MYNVSFGKAPVFVNPNMYIKNAKSSEIAEAINIGVKQAGETIGKKIKFPHDKMMTGKLLRETNPDSFSKATQVLTETGRNGFNKIVGRQLGITTESKLCDLVAGVKEFAKQDFHRCGDTLTTTFKYMA